MQRLALLGCLEEAVCRKRMTAGKFFLEPVARRGLSDFSQSRRATGVSKITFPSVVRKLLRALFVLSLTTVGAQAQVAVL